MKILAMIFGSTPRCHRSSRRADDARGLRVARVVAQTMADRFARIRCVPLVPAAPSDRGSSHAQLRYMPTSALSFLTAFLQAGLF